MCKVRRAQGLCCDLHSVWWCGLLTVLSCRGRMMHWLFGPGLHLCVLVEQGGDCVACVFLFSLSLLCVGGTVAPCALWGGDCACLCASCHCCCLVSYCALGALQHSCRAVLSDLHSVLQHACPCSSCMVWVSILLDASGLVGASLSSSTHQHSLRVQVMACWLSSGQSHPVTHAGCHPVRTHHGALACRLLMQAKHGACSPLHSCMCRMLRG